MNKNLKSARKCADLTQAELAKKVQLSVRHYQGIEASTSAPNVYTAQSIAKALNTTVEAIFPVFPSPSV